MNRMKVDAACFDGKLSAGCESQFKTDNATELQRWRGHWTLASQGQLAASGQWRQSGDSYRQRGVVISCYDRGGELTNVF